MPEKQYISKITLPNGQTYEIKDQEARDAIASLIGGGLSFKISTDAASTPAGVEWINDSVKVTGILVASTDTKAFVYLVPHEKDGTGHVDFYREYVTVNFGDETTPVFAWEFLGDTDIDLSGLGALAWKSTASGVIGVTTADSAAFSNGAASVSGTFTPAGSVAVTLSQTGTAASLTKGDYTPEGTVSVSLGQTSTAATLTQADYTPAGTVSKPDITVTPSTTTVEVKDAAGSVTAGSAASFTQGHDNFTAATHGADQFVAPTWTATVPLDASNASTETLVFSFNAGSFTSGAFTGGSFQEGTDTFVANTPTSVTLPTFKEQSVMTGASAALDNAPVFTGTLAADLQVTGVAYDKASVSSASFSGSTATNALVTGVTYDKAGVESAEFTGTEGNVSATGSVTGDVSLTKTEKSINVTVQ